MTNKQCTDCREAKPLDQFHKDKQARDGRRNQCKRCASAYRKEWRKRNEKRLRELGKEWNKRNRKRRRKYVKENHPEKAKARQAVENAVYKGRLMKPDHCEGCGKPFEKRQLQGHHEDYSKKLEVEWLCRTCHGLRHSEEERSDA